MKKYAAIPIIKTTMRIKIGLFPSVVLVVKVGVAVAATVGAAVAVWPDGVAVGVSCIGVVLTVTGVGAIDATGVAVGVAVTVGVGEAVELITPPLEET